MLALEDCRRVFAERITRCAAEKQSFERALMAACEYAYRRGLADGQANTAGASMGHALDGHYKAMESAT